MSDDMLTVIPEPIVAKIKGETIQVRQIKVGQLPKAMRIAHPFYEQLKSLKDQALKAEKEGKPFTYGMDFYKLVMENAEPILEMVALLTNKDRAWVDDLEVDELVALFSAIVEVNLDFFIQRVLPSLSGLVTGAAEQIKTAGDGQTLSKH